MKKIKAPKHSLEKLRMALGDAPGALKQEEAAKIFGITRPLLACIEAGKRRLTEDVADKISIRVGVDAQWLLANKPGTPIRWLTSVPFVPATATLAEHSETLDERINRQIVTPLDASMRNDWQEELAIVDRFGAAVAAPDAELLAFFSQVIRLLALTARAARAGGRLPFAFRLGRFLEKAEAEYGSDAKLAAQLMSAIYYGNRSGTFFDLRPLLKTAQAWLGEKPESKVQSRKEKSK